MRDGVVLTEARVHGRLEGPADCPALAGRALVEPARHVDRLVDPVAAAEEGAEVLAMHRVVDLALLPDASG